MKSYLTIKNFVKKHPHFLSEGGIRHLIFNSQSNNFETCIRRAGRRIFLDEEEVFSWVDKQNNHKNKQ